VTNENVAALSGVMYKRIKFDRVKIEIEVTDDIKIVFERKK